MVWPLIAVGVGIGALVARRGVRILSQSNVQVPSYLRVSGVNNWRQTFFDYTRNLQGFETPMSVTEACKILNVSPAASKDSIIKAHRSLMLRNHPDNGGSNFVASKVNEAKELLVGAK